MNKEAEEKRDFLDDREDDENEQEEVDTEDEEGEDEDFEDEVGSEDDPDADGQDSGDNHDEDDNDDDNDDDDEDFDEDDDYEDSYEDVQPPPQTEEEPEYSGTGMPIEYYQDADEEQQEFKDEITEDEKQDRRYGNRCLAIVAAVCCCILLLLVFFLILYFLVFNKKNDGGNSNIRNPSPTPAPFQPAQVPSPVSNLAPITPMPFSYPTALPITPEPTVGPTLVPTFTPVPTVAATTRPPTKSPTGLPTITPAPTKNLPNDIVLIPIADTYITDSFDSRERHGDFDTFLVQNSLDHVREDPTAFALLQFDMSTVPFAETSNEQRQAVLELTHVVSVAEDRPAFATLTVERLPSTVLEVESLHLGLFPLPENGITGPSFNVAPTDEKVYVDITELIFGGLYEPEDDEQAFLMIVNYGIEQTVGNSFYTRESPRNEPRLLIGLSAESFVKITNSPTPDLTDPPEPESTANETNLEG